MNLIKSSTTLIAALACLGLTGAAIAQKEFEPNRDSFSQPGVPQGVMHLSMGAFAHHSGRGGGDKTPKAVQVVRG